MRKFGVMPAWFLVSDGERVALPQRVVDDIASAIRVDVATEPLLAVCWTQTVLGGAVAFVLVTRDRIISKTSHSLRQVRFRDVIGVQRSVLGKDVVAVTPALKLDLFNWMQMPPVALCDELFRIIEAHWRAVA